MKKGVFYDAVCVGLTTVLLIAGSLKSAEADPDAKKIRDIKKLLIVSGIHEQMGFMKTNLINSFGQAISMTYPKIPEPFWNEFGNLIEQKEVDDLIERVVVVYAKHMSHDAIKELIKMFDTPFWKEWREKMPIISREAGMIGSRWGQEITQAKAFQDKIDNLIVKYDLEKLNPSPTESNTEDQKKP